MTAEASCNRCGGDGTVSLQDQDITCPQCKGTGTGENNAGQDAADLLSANSAWEAPARDMHGIPETRVSSRTEFELREVPNGTGGTNLRFTGFASTTDTEYEMEDWLGPFVESVSSGAFRKTLSEGADVAFLLNHQGMTLARTKSGTLKLSEETDGKRSPVYGVTGLHSEALLDPTNMHVQTMRSAVDRGDLDEMSFAFRVMRQEWNAEYDRRWINEVSLDKGDVSLVNYGANPTTFRTAKHRTPSIRCRRQHVGQTCVDVHVIRQSRSVVHEVVHRRNSAATKARIAALEALVDALRSRALQ